MRDKRKMSLAQYKKAKIKMLTKEFLINLSSDEIAHFDELQNEIQVDAYVKTLFSKLC